MKVLIVGDVVHSRVARSNIWLLQTLGAEVILAAPATLLPQSVGRWPVTVRYSLDDALAEGPDAVMMLRVQAERMGGAYFPHAAEYSSRWGLTDERLKVVERLRMGDADRRAIILHPGPMNRGVEISAAAADSAQSRITDQVAHGVSVRMAVLHLLLTGGPDV